VPRFSL